MNINSLGIKKKYFINESKSKTQGDKWNRS